MLLFSDGIGTLNPILRMGLEPEKSYSKNGFGFIGIDKHHPSANQITPPKKRVLHGFPKNCWFVFYVFTDFHGGFYSFDVFIFRDVNHSYPTRSIHLRCPKPPQGNLPPPLGSPNTTNDLGTVCRNLGGRGKGSTGSGDWV